MGHRYLVRPRAARRARSDACGPPALPLAFVLSFSYASALFISHSHVRSRSAAVLYAYGSMHKILKEPSSFLGFSHAPEAIKIGLRHIFALQSVEQALKYRCSSRLPMLEADQAAHSHISLCLSFSPCSLRRDGHRSGSQNILRHLSIDMVPVVVVVPRQASVVHHRRPSSRPGSSELES